ncbi:AAA family ATPase [Bacilliculturomica massiliensis]|uniref:AAA family ATPase n=1 Tax=Bacilliculturomica massiliensis TaxID=1917867 RepID=UPI0010315765|nr:AAA family ATPase [Bacilliculturomica massiliensis]
MGIPVLIIGESGSGKSASMRNFKKGEVGIINVANKPLPFKGNLGSFATDNYDRIKEIMHKAKTKSLVVDDAQYLMANEFMRRSKETGYQKFTDIGKNFWDLIMTVINELPGDIIVYFLGHLERDADGHEKFKTVGKMLDEKITTEGLFSIVLKTSVQDGKYSFSTQTNGMDTVKSPIGLFEETSIDNDLKMVDQKIREYYELDKTPAVKKTEVQ